MATASGNGDPRGAVLLPPRTWGPTLTGHHEPSVAGAGDVDGEGHGDLIVGAWAANLCGNNDGAALQLSAG